MWVTSCSIGPDPKQNPLLLGAQVTSPLLVSTNGTVLFGVAGIGSKIDERCMWCVYPTLKKVHCTLAKAEIEVCCFSLLMD